MGAFSPVPCECLCRSARVPRSFRFILGAVRSEEVNSRMVPRWYGQEGVFNANCVCFLLMGLYDRFRATCLQAVYVDNERVRVDVYYRWQGVFRVFIHWHGKETGVGTAWLAWRRSNGTWSIFRFHWYRFHFVCFCPCKWAIHFNYCSFNGRLFRVTIRLLRGFRVSFHRFLFICRQGGLPMDLIDARGCFLRATLILLLNWLFNMLYCFIMNTSLAARVRELNRYSDANVCVSYVYARNVCW